MMLDADGSTDPQEIPAYVDALFDGADFAKGSRFMEGGGSVDITPLRLQGNRFLNGTVNALFGTDYSDLCYGYNAFWSDVRPTINVDCAGFEVETLINVRVCQGWSERRRGPQRRTRADSRGQQAASFPRRVPCVADDPGRAFRQKGRSPGQRGSAGPRARQRWARGRLVGRAGGSPNRHGLCGLTLDESGHDEHPEAGRSTPQAS